MALVPVASQESCSVRSSLRTKRAVDGGHSAALAGYEVSCCLTESTPHPSATTLGSHEPSGERIDEMSFLDKLFEKKEFIIELGPKVTMEFVRIPAGRFLMGSDIEGKKRYVYHHELPQHKVYLDEYLIGRTSVTNKQYEAFAQATGYSPPSYWKDRMALPEQWPVRDLIWKDAVVFCEWVSRKTGMIVRLPSEAEWEKAARGTDGRIYPWGNQLSEDREMLRNMRHLAYDYNSEAAEGRIYPEDASPYGCLDMAGVVRNWVADWYDEKYYASSPDRNPPGPASGTYRVVRGGGSWLNTGRFRSTNRYKYEPDSRKGNAGFRCVLSPTQF